MTADERRVISTRIIGVLHRHEPKLKVFMVSVLWTDGSEVIVYRSFKDFRKFHRQLKKRFPQLNPFRKSDRQLPKFRGKARRASMPQKRVSRALLRMNFLEDYCGQLLQRDVAVSQSSEVRQFFTPKDQDLQPEFTRNTVMILQSDDIPDASVGRVELSANAARQHGTGNVSHPFITQTYRCVAAFETKDTKNRPFKAAVDEKVDVLIKDPAGWWLVENEDKRLAWFPAPYLELCDEEDEDDGDVMRAPGLQHAGAFYCAVRSISSQKPDELSVAIGAVVEVLRQSDDGWWLARFNGKSGYVPSMYLQPYTHPRSGLFGPQGKLHGSTLDLAGPRRASVGIEAFGRTPARPAPSSLHRARSLDVLSESWSQATPPTQRANSGPDPDHDQDPDPAELERRLSSDSNFSIFSTGSESTSSSRETEEDEEPQGRQEATPPTPAPPQAESRAESSASFGGSGFSVGPRVPPRPKTNEIMSRCTTMTRKAAMASRARLQHGAQAQTQAQHGR